MEHRARDAQAFVTGTTDVKGPSPDGSGTREEVDVPST